MTSRRHMKGAFKSDAAWQSAIKVALEMLVARIGVLLKAAPDPSDVCIVARILQKKGGEFEVQAHPHTHAEVLKLFLHRSAVANEADAWPIADVIDRRIREFSADGSIPIIFLGTDRNGAPIVATAVAMRTPGPMSRGGDA